MAKYISSIKDLVIQAMTNVFAINEKAKKNDAEACFQMGMIYLLGINVPIDFKKVKQCLENDSLKDNSEALLLLGLVAELEGDYSLAFKNYFNVSKLDGNNSGKQYSYYVAKERESLKSYLKTLGLPTKALSNTISTILENHAELESSIKIAMICRDEETCTEAILNLCEAGDDSSAKKMLQLCHIDLSENAHIKKVLFEQKEEIILSNSIQIIDIEGNSFLSEPDFTPYFDTVCRAFNNLATQCRLTWEKEMKQEIEEEKARVKKEIEEEKARIRRQEEEERARIERQAEEEEEEELARKTRKMKKVNLILNIIYALPTMLSCLVLLSIDGPLIYKLITVIAVLAICYLPFYIIKWLAKKIIMR